MSWLKRWWKRTRNLLRKGAVENELDQELAFHLEMEVKKNIRAGMTPKEARRQAAIDFGGVDRYKEEVRAARATSGLDNLVTDILVEARRLAKGWRFTVPALALLTLGIGVNATVFSAIRASLLKTLPFPDPAELVVVDLTEASNGRGMIWSWSRLDALRDQVASDQFSISAYGTSSLTYAATDATERVDVEFVERSYLDVLGLRPTLGPGFSSDPNDMFQIVLSDGFWRQAFGADRNILSQTLVLDGHTFTVVGVAPAGFRGLSGSARGWIPLEAAAVVEGPGFLGPSRHWLRGIGRLEGGSFEAARTQVQTAGALVQELYPDRDPDMVLSADLVRLQDARVNENARRSLLLLAVAAVLVLLTACANLGGLLATRSIEQSREMAVRSALGAGRWRMIRSRLIEGLLLAGGGSVLGLLAAVAGSRVVTAAWPQRFVDGEWNLQFVDPASISVDWTVLAFAIGLATVSGLLASTVPAWRASRTDPGSALRTRPGAGGSLRASWFRSGLLATQVAVTLILVVGAQLLISSFRNLQSVNRGVTVSNVLTFQVSVPGGSQLEEDMSPFAVPFLQRLEAMPGVEAAGRGCPPLAGYHCAFAGVSGFDGRDLSEDPVMIGWNVVDPGFMAALEIPVLDGYIPEGPSNLGQPPLVVLTQAAARSLASNGASTNDVVGRPIVFSVRSAGAGGLGAQVTGLTEDILFDTPDRGLMPEAFVLSGQEPDARSWVVRTQSDPYEVLPAIRAAARDLDPGVVLVEPQTLEQMDRQGTADTRLILGLLGLFSALALAISSTGIWGNVAQMVQARRKELAVRVALGGRSPSVVGLMVRRGMMPVAMGVAVGAFGGWAATRLLAAQLYQVAPTDPAAFGTGVLVLAGVGFLASWFPARKAMRIQPMTVLRME